MAKVRKYYKVSLAQISKKSFWNSYDNLGRLLMMNFFAVILSITIIGIPFAAIGLYTAARKMVNYEDVELKDFRRQWSIYWKRGVLLTLLLIAIFIVLIVNFKFYMDLLEHKDLAGAAGVILSLIFGLMIWLLVFYCMFIPYAFPVLIAMNSTVKATLRNSFFLMMDNLKVTIYLFINCLIWLVLGFLTASIIALFLSFGVIAVVSSTVVRELLKQYEESQPEEEEMRGLRDLIKPWS